jgi:hypothetical protein
MKMASWISAGVLAAAALAAGSASALSLDFSDQLVDVTDLGDGVFTFEQVGFSGGATATGGFTGTDLNDDGQLSSFQGEITDFYMAFSGNSFVQAFNLGFDDLFGLVYDNDGGPLGDGLGGDIEGIGAQNFQFAYLAGAGPLGGGPSPTAVDICDCAPINGLVSDLLGGAPEPSTWAMMLAGFGMTGAALRRRRIAAAL